MGDEWRGKLWRQRTRLAGSTATVTTSVTVTTTHHIYFLAQLFWFWLCHLVCHIFTCCFSFTQSKKKTNRTVGVANIYTSHIYCINGIIYSQQKFFFVSHRFMAYFSSNKKKISLSNKSLENFEHFCWAIYE